MPQNYFLFKEYYVIKGDYLWLHIIQVLENKEWEQTKGHVVSIYLLILTCIGKTCHQRIGKFDKCQKSNSVFLIQTSEKGKSLQGKPCSEIIHSAAKRSALSHLLPTHPHQHSSRTMTVLYRASKAQSMFMSARLPWSEQKWPMQQTMTRSFTSNGFFTW